MAYAIYSVEITPGINATVNSKHRVTADEVLEVCYSRNHEARWDIDPDHGERLLVRGRTRAGRRILVILHPVDPDQGQWRLKTAIAQTGR